jgi:two-component system phosphate regulon sensor histidine kinase PhoR
MFSIGLALMTLAFLSTFLVVRYVTTPLRKLSQATTRIARGNFNTSVTVRGKGELGDLAENFNLMTGQIRKLFKNVSGEKEKLSRIVDTINDGLLLVDESGKVIMANLRFEGIIRGKNLKGSDYRESVFQKEIVQLIDKTIKTNKNYKTEIQMSGKVFFCQTIYYTYSKEVILTIHDVTGLKDLENMKKDLVANVSHELRTPLTAIKGYLETLRDEVKGDALRYVTIAERHTERLNNLVRDLLILSKLEDETQPIIFGKVKIENPLHNAMTLLEKKAREKKIKLNAKIQESLILEKGDAIQLEQLFINLIDNSIKYTEKGSVEINAHSTDDKVIITIQDTGIGIKPESIGRIFERFYVVDPSRSRNQGGTGLGLSIVKHIIANHGGHIDVESTPGTGSIFTLTFPV